MGLFNFVQQIAGQKASMATNGATTDLIGAGQGDQTREQLIEQLRKRRKDQGTASDPTQAQYGADMSGSRRSMAARMLLGSVGSF